MKFIIIGDGEHGKDTVCNILHDMYGLRFISSSYFAGERHVRGALAKQGLHYPSFEACYADRANHRAAWHDAIAEYCKDDPLRLGRELFEQYDVYCGARSLIEFAAMREAKLFDFCWWVDRSLHVPPEPFSSNKLDKGLADTVIDNNGSVAQTTYRVALAYRQAEQYFRARQKQ